MFNLSFENPKLNVSSIALGMVMCHTKSMTKRYRMIRPSKASKEKVTVSIDADLLAMVDSFVQNSQESSVSRSSVFEQALQLWKQELRNSFDQQYYAKNAEALNDSSWTALTTEAAKITWRDQL